MLILPLVWLAASLHGSDLPPGDGQAIVQRACGGCHALKVVTSKRATPQQWSTVVDQMVSRGADVDDDEIETLVAYLSKNFPADAKADQAPADHAPTGQVNVNRATAAELASVLGVSAKDADAIVAYREQNGDFKTIADLTKVPGIDTKKIVSSKSRVRF